MCIEQNLFDDKTLQALKSCITGLTTKEVISEYVADENGDLHIAKQKINEKTIPPNTDIIKLIYQHYTDEQVGYEKMTDDELEQEKTRLLKLLKEKESDSRKSKSKSQM